MDRRRGGPAASGDRQAQRWVRRRLLGTAAALLGLPAIGLAGVRLVGARHDDDDDGGGDDGGSRRGRGRGRGRGDEEGGEAPLIPVEIPPGAVVIEILDDDVFTPNVLEIDAGQLVAFVNRHDDDHTATGSGFDTGVIPPGAVATVTMTKPGLFRFACRFHPEMIGEIGVRGADGLVPAPVASTPIAAGEAAATVRIVDFAFEPTNVAVPVGGAVSWRQAGAAPHTVTADGGAFDSGILDAGGEFGHRFTTPGTFAYRCALHPQMVGEVVVTGDAGATSVGPPANSTSVAATPGATPAPVTSPTAEATPVAAVIGVADGPTVVIVDFAFEPAALRVAVGSTVTWLNQGQAPHTASGIEPGESFDTGILGPGQPGGFRFDRAGTFPYRCLIHPEMVGQVVVE